MRRVVVTGLGAVCPIGNDVQTIWVNALKGTSGVGPVTRFDASQFGCQIAVYWQNQRENRSNQRMG